MNFFELYQIPITLSPDTTQVKSKYYSLSREYHPDFMSQASEEAQEKGLEMSALVNQGYKLLMNPAATIQYVLKLKGLLEEDEKYQLSPEFLMEMMDLNEQAMEMTESSEKESLTKTIENLQNELYAAVEPIITNYQEGISTEKELLQVKEYYFRKKYLNRILEGLR